MSENISFDFEYTYTAPDGTERTADAVSVHLPARHSRLHRATCATILDASHRMVPSVMDTQKMLELIASDGKQGLVEDGNPIEVLEAGLEPSEVATFKANVLQAMMRTKGVLRAGSDGDDIGAAGFRSIRENGGDDAIEKVFLAYLHMFTPFEIRGVADA